MVSGRWGSFQNSRNRGGMAAVQTKATGGYRGLRMGPQWPREARSAWRDGFLPSVGQLGFPPGSHSGPRKPRLHSTSHMVAESCFAPGLSFAELTSPSSKLRKWINGIKGKIAPPSMLPTLPGPHRLGLQCGMGPSFCKVTLHTRSPVRMPFARRGDARR